MMALPDFPHLPDDLARGIAAYDVLIASGRLTFETHPQHDMPVLDGVPWIMRRVRHDVPG